MSIVNNREGGLGTWTVLWQETEAGYFLTRCSSSKTECPEVLRHLIILNSTKLRKSRRPLRGCSRDDLSSYTGVCLLSTGKPQSFQCDTCPFTSSKLSTFNRHIKIHSNERPHLCHLCLKAFRTVTLLRNHVNTHTGEVPGRGSLSSQTHHKSQGAPASSLFTWGFTVWRKSQKLRKALAQPTKGKVPGSILSTEKNKTNCRSSNSNI